MLIIPSPKKFIKTFYLINLFNKLYIKISNIFRRFDQFDDQRPTYWPKGQRVHWQVSAVLWRMNRPITVTITLFYMNRELELDDRYRCSSISFKRWVPFCRVIHMNNWPLIVVSKRIRRCDSTRNVLIIVELISLDSRDRLSRWPLQSQYSRHYCSFQIIRVWFYYTAIPLNSDKVNKLIFQIQFTMCFIPNRK